MPRLLPFLKHEEKSKIRHPLRLAVPALVLLCGLAASGCWRVVRTLPQRSRPFVLGAVIVFATIFNRIKRQAAKRKRAAPVAAGGK